MAERLSKLEFEDESLVALTPIVANSVSNINNVEEESGLSRADIVQGSLLRIILTYMISNHYEEASRAIEDHVDSRRDYPGFRDRTERFREHANQVIIAIQQQRELLKASNLSNSKQHDLRGRIQYQFKELRKSLVSIEKIEREMKVEDFKTTVWVVKAWFLAVISIFMILFVKEVSNGILPAIGSLYYDLVEKVLSYLF